METQISAWVCHELGESKAGKEAIDAVALAIHATEFQLPAGSSQPFQFVAGPIPS